MFMLEPLSLSKLREFLAVIYRELKVNKGNSILLDVEKCDIIYVLDSSIQVMNILNCKSIFPLFQDLVYTYKMHSGLYFNLNELYIIPKSKKEEEEVYDFDPFPNMIDIVPELATKDGLDLAKYYYHEDIGFIRCDYTKEMSRMEATSLMKLLYNSYNRNTSYENTTPYNLYVDLEKDILHHKTYIKDEEYDYIFKDRYLNLRADDLVQIFKFSSKYMITLFAKAIPYNKPDKGELYITDLGDVGIYYKFIIKKKNGCIISMYYRTFSLIQPS